MKSSLVPLYGYLSAHHPLKDVEMTLVVLWDLLGKLSVQVLGYVQKTSLQDFGGAAAFQLSVPVAPFTPFSNGPAPVVPVVQPLPPAPVVPF